MTKVLNLIRGFVKSLAGKLRARRARCRAVDSEDVLIKLGQHRQLPAADDAKEPVKVRGDKTALHITATTTLITSPQIHIANIHSEHEHWRTLFLVRWRGCVGEQTCEHTPFS